MFISLVSINKVLLSTHVSFAPNSDKILHEIFTSLMLGTFSIVHVPFINRAAGNIATAAFFAPFIVTSPRRFVGPFINNFSNCIPPKIFIT